jgi:hypothetical protein
MNTRRFEELAIGDTICDMHDGLYVEDVTGRLFNRIGTTVALCEEPHRLTARIEIEAPGGSAFIQAIIRDQEGLERWHYVNKFLVILDFYRDRGKGIVKAAYSYDGRRFGLLQFEVDL